jgi:hypothetical protein
MLDFWADVFAIRGSRTTGDEAQFIVLTGLGWQGDLPTGATPHVARPTSCRTRPQQRIPDLMRVSAPLSPGYAEAGSISMPRAASGRWSLRAVEQGTTARELVHGGAFEEFNRVDHARVRILNIGSGAGLIPTFLLSASLQF